MKNMKKKRNCIIVSRAVLIFCFISFLLSVNFFAGDIKVIKNPKPTHIEKKYVSLKLVKEIRDEIDDEHFFVKPTYLVPDKDGFLYVFDAGLTRIFKLDKYLQFVKMFGRKGKGPGEMLGFFSNSPNMSLSPEGKLYVSSPGNRKIIVYSKDGKLEKDIRTPDDFRKLHYRPVLDIKGNIYVHSDKGGAVDILDSSARYLKTLLNPDAYKTFVLFPPPKESIQDHTKNGPFNTFYDTLPDNGFIIYITQSSTVYLFKNQKLTRKFNVWPAKLLKKYKETVEKVKKEYPDYDMNRSSIPFCVSFFIDKDNEDYFYIESSLGYRSLYKFNLKGELISVLQSKKEDGNFVAKQNGLFYGVRRTDGRVFIYKEDL
jgi:hypothetical protein